MHGFHNSQQPHRTEQHKIQWRERKDTTYGDDALWFYAPEGVRVFTDWKHGLWEAALLAHRTGAPVTPECALYILTPVQPTDLQYRGRLYADALRDNGDCLLLAPRTATRDAEVAALYQQEREVRAIIERT